MAWEHGGHGHDDGGGDDGHGNLVGQQNLMIRLSTNGMIRCGDGRKAGCGEMMRNAMFFIFFSRDTL